MTDEAPRSGYNHISAQGQRPLLLFVTDAVVASIDTYA